MGNRTSALFLCIVGLLTALVSLEYLGLLHQSPLGALALYTIGVLGFVFGVRGVIRN
jgi:hypothetical protein